MTTDWTDTPFKTIEEARKLAAQMGSKPTAIITNRTKGYRYFQISEGRKQIVIAQAVMGGPVKERCKRSKKAPLPLQDPNVPTFGDNDRLLVGPWVPSRHASLGEAETHWKDTYVNFDNVEVLEIVLYRVGGDEYEYVAAPSGVWQRVLSRKK